MASRQSVLNLASRPFANRRPVKRAGIALWSIALILTVVNGLLYWSYQSGSSEGREELQRVRSDIAAEGEALRALSDELKAFDLQALNPKADYLNERIAERTFPWSRLFDDLVEALPIQVRLSSLSPRAPDQRRLARDESAKDWIELEIRGYAANGEALLDLVDALFEHPAFSAPTLLNERRDNAGEITFALNARYRSKSPSREAVVTASTPAAPSARASDENAASAPGSDSLAATGAAPVAQGESPQAPRPSTNRSPIAEPLSAANPRPAPEASTEAPSAPSRVEFSLPSASAPATQGGRP